MICVYGFSISYIPGFALRCVILYKILPFSNTLRWHSLNVNSEVQNRKCLRWIPRLAEFLRESCLTPLGILYLPTCVGWGRGISGHLLWFLVFDRNERDAKRSPTLPWKLRHLGRVEDGARHGSGTMMDTRKKRCGDGYVGAEDYCITRGVGEMTCRWWQTEGEC